MRTVCINIIDKCCIIHFWYALFFKTRHWANTFGYTFRAIVCLFDCNTLYLQHRQAHAGHYCPLFIFFQIFGSVRMRLPTVAAEKADLQLFISRSCFYVTLYVCRLCRCYVHSSQVINLVVSDLSRSVHYLLYVSITVYQTTLNVAVYSWRW